MGELAGVLLAPGVGDTILVGATVAVFAGVGVEVRADVDEGITVGVEVFIGVLVIVSVLVGEPTRVGLGVLDSAEVGLAIGVVDRVIRTAVSVDKLVTVTTRSPLALVVMVSVLVAAPVYVFHHSTLNGVLAANPAMVTVPVSGVMVPVFVQI